MKRLLILILPLFICVGCASSIYNSGRYSNVLKSGSDRAKVREELGPPIDSGILADFKYVPFDDFLVRGPVSDSMRATGAGMGTAMTFGLYEFVALPQAIWWALTNRGPKMVRVTYSESLRYQYHTVSDAKPAAKNSKATPAETDRLVEK